MAIQKYQGGFENWSDVQREFATDAPEPSNLIVAYYEYENYEGDAYVCWRDGDDVYEVHGGHCSCYGLEGQFEPEKVNINTHREALRRTEVSNWWYSFTSRNRDALIEVLSA